MEDFSTEHLMMNSCYETNIEFKSGKEIECNMSSMNILGMTIEALNSARQSYLETKDKIYWWQMIQLLPSSYNQTRNVMLNYEVLANIYGSRRNHKLDEWCEFCKWIEGLPYSELICGFCFKDFEDGSSSIETLNDLGVLTKIPNAARVAIGLSPIGTSDELTFSKED